MSILEIVLSGGPHSGRSSSISYVQQKLQELGYKVLLVPNSLELLEGSATANIEELSYRSKDNELIIQLVKTQDSLRRHWYEMAKSLPDQKVVLIHSQTAVDFAPYIPDFEELLVRSGLTMRYARDNYDLVIHLTSTAGTADYERAREKDSPNALDAKQIDAELLKAWTGAPHLRVIKIDSTTLFKEKLKHVFAAVARVLGAPPREIEHKYLLKDTPTAKKLLAMGAVPIEIEQTYLLSTNPELEIRLRKRMCGAQVTYYHTHKKKISDLVREETDRIITYREYNELILFKDPLRGTIKKTRYCIVANEHYLELDLFENPAGLALLEVEVDDDKAKVDLPKEWVIDKEVSLDPAWSNYAISKKASLN